MQRRIIEANGLAFHCLSCGSGPRLALMLHGFPDDPGSWEPLMRRLAEAGYTAVAPWMRGYGETGPAPDDRYRPTDTGADAVALARALGFEEAVLIGHDWGAAAAYSAAALEPSLWRAIVAMSVPPNPRFVGNLWRDPSQLGRSWYMAYFNLPGAAARVRKKDMAFLDRLWRDWCPGWQWPPERLAAVKDSLRPEGNLEAALTYYHEVGRRLITDPAGARAGWEVGARAIDVPCLMLSGADDGCIQPTMFAGAEAQFTGPVRFEIIPGAGHFLPMEAPDAVWQAMADFIPL